MSKTIKTEQPKTKSRLASETLAKKSTTSKPPATKPTVKSKSVRSTETTATPAKLTTTKEATSSKSLSTRETKDTKVTPRIVARKENSGPSISKLNATNAVKVKTTTEKSNRAIKTQATKPTATTSVKKITSTVSKNASSKVSEQRTQPLRAKHTAAIVESVRKNTAYLNASKTSSKPNLVLDTYHNVTVTSPPPQRKEQPHVTISDEKPKSPEEINTRPRTRTLDTNEVLILKSESARLRSEQEVLQNDETEQQPKEPIAFEVKFEEQAKPTRERSRSRSKTITNNTERDEDEYADDFESYESDFETGSSSQAGSGTESADDSSGTSSISSENESDSDAESGLSGENVKNLKPASNSEEEEEEEEDESELTQFPITVIQRDKDRERKLDSGNYEMPICNNQKRLAELSDHLSQPTFEDSLDTFSAGASEQLDSGISSYDNASKSISGLPTDAVTYGGYANFNTKPVMSKRGLELMSKIKFDTLTFALLDLKPITYDVFMQTFGKLNTTQCSTQTQEQRISIECQTDDYESRSIWTQHPPQYDLSTMQQLSGLGTISNYCGELPINGSDFSAKPRDQYENSLLELSLLRVQTDTRTAKQHLRSLHKPVDCERLNQFLQRSALLISNVLNANNGESSSSQNRQKVGSNNTLSAISVGYRQLDTHFLNALHVVRIFANPQHNLVLTVHACHPDADVYRSDFSNLLMLWSTTDANAKPLRLLSTWSEVCRAEICAETSDIVVCGLRDGSVALWDLRETHSFCSKLDGYLTHFAATQSIVPSLEEKSSKKFKDIGAAVDVKSFRNAPSLANSVAGYKTIQFISLHDTGILTVWTLIETGKVDNTLDNLPNTSRRGANVTPTQVSREYSSPWARVKLMQSAIYNLSDYLERGIQKARSKFDKTKALFQHNIYSDQVLRELNETQLGLNNTQELQGLRFTNIDVGCERVYVCTNRNFIITCSKSLKVDRFRKININESRFLFPTALRVLSNEDFLAVGLSNGSVIILNCSQNKSDELNAHSERKLPKVSSAQLTPNQDYELETGKSCAIQNIILNERRAFDPTEFNQSFEERPSTTAACLTMINEQKKPYELRVYDQQLLLSGSVLRKNLVQSLELSRDGWRLFALSDGEIRSYDFFLDREVVDNSLTEHVGVEKIHDIAVASNGKSEQHLLLLQANDDVQLHLLKQ